MVEGNVDEGELTFAGYMKRFENTNIYFSKLLDITTSSRAPLELRN